jgi:hypothetical protein
MTRQSNEYTARQREVIIRQARNHRIVAIIEILSPGNKASEYPFTQLHPHRGVGVPPHGNLRSPRGTALTVVSYEAGPITTAYVEPLAIGQALPAASLFLEPGWHVKVPLEATYQVAWEGTPAYFRDILTHDPAAE